MFANSDEVRQKTLVNFMICVRKKCKTWFRPAESALVKKHQTKLLSLNMSSPEIKVDVFPEYSRVSPPVK